MSRNLARTGCYYCPADNVQVTGVATPFPRRYPEMTYYHAEYAGLVVADAECKLCGAQYVAWLNRPRSYPGWEENIEAGYVDLSFRSTFNDEADAPDLPLWKVVEERSRYRTGPWRGCGYADGTADMHHEACRWCAEAAAWREAHRDELRLRRAPHALQATGRAFSPEFAGKTDEDIADAIINRLLANQYTGSDAECLLATAIERLRRARGGPLS